jgi:hypothetical protein
MVRRLWTYAGDVVTDEPSYGLLMPFVTVTSKGGPHDDESYTAGWEMGALDSWLANGGTAVHSQVIRSDNRDQADLIAMRHGYRMTAGVETDGWLNVIFTRGGTS